MSSLGTLEQMEADLCQAADQLRANLKLLRRATNRYKVALQQIQDEQAAGKMPKRR
jgi:type I restriction enzyme M protein